MVKAYFDASGQMNVHQDRFITLAGTIGDEKAWKRFEAEWGSVLERFDAPRTDFVAGQDAIGLRYFHSREAFHLREGYANWTKDRVSRLDTELLNTLFRCARGNADNAANIWPVSCTVSKDGYEAAKRNNPHIPSITQLCLNQCLSVALSHPETPSGIEIYFDRGCKDNEPYWNDLDALINKRNPRRPFWATAVGVCARIKDNIKVYGIQAADVLAWSANRHFRKDEEDRENDFRMFIVSMGTNLLYSYWGCDEITARYDADGRLIEGLKSPTPTIRYSGRPCS